MRQPAAAAEPTSAGMAAWWAMGIMNGVNLAKGLTVAFGTNGRDVPCMRLALIEPDIAPNTGAILRLAACLDVGVDIVEPCGFVWSAPKLRRAGLDYLDHVDLRRHESWAAFRRDRAPGRLVLLTTKGDVALPRFRFRSDDILLLGRESTGAPPEIHGQVDARLVIPMAPGMRSLNVALAAALALGEALRQTERWPTTALAS